jgi:hypothetical protein
MGMSAVTVVDLAGAASRTLSDPPPPGTTAGTAAVDRFGAFAVDHGDVYVCNDVVGVGARLERFGADGSWRVLFMSSASSESCFAGAIAVDAESVYWSTTRGIHAWDRASGSVRTVVDAQGTLLPFPELAVSGASIVWLSDGIRVANKTASNLTPTAGALLVALPPSDPAVFSLAATQDHVYWQTQVAIRRVPISGGAVEVLAQRSPPPGAYMGLALSGSVAYFVEARPAGDESYEAVLRSAP